ncbi:MAG: hypothetical protein ABH856_05055, partial [Patescibacteria group bacterium]
VNELLKMEGAYEIVEKIIGEGKKIRVKDKILDGLLKEVKDATLKTPEEIEMIRSEVLHLLKFQLKVLKRMEAGGSRWEMVDEENKESVIRDMRSGKIVKKLKEVDGEFQHEEKTYRVADGKVFIVEAGVETPTEDLRVGNSRRKYNLGINGAALRVWRTLGLRAAQTGKDLANNNELVMPDIPDSMSRFTFRANDDPGFMDLVRGEVRRMIYTAQHSIDALIPVMEARVLSGEKVKAIKEVLGDKVFAITEQINILRGLSGFGLDKKLTPKFIQALEDAIIESAERLYAELGLDKEKSDTPNRVEEAYRAAFCDETGENKGFPSDVWEAISDKHGAEFTQELHKRLKTMIVIQPFTEYDILHLPSQKRYEKVEYQHDDFKRAMRRLLGHPEEDYNYGRAQALRRDHSVHTDRFVPQVVQTHARPIGAFASDGEQKLALETLSEKTGDPYKHLSGAGVIAMALADTIQEQSLGEPRYLRSDAGKNMLVEYEYKDDDRKIKLNVVPEKKRGDEGNVHPFTFGKCVELGQQMSNAEVADSTG